ncbi:hypothetical protein GC387_35550, partial [Pseudomonas sp. MWU12-2323]|nr:hypothetical protein [Pseudomonas sp. MWU12-2323]
EQASELFYLLPGTLAEGRVELTRRESEFRNMSDSLADWSTEHLLLHPISGDPFTLEEVLNEQEARLEFKNRIEQSWRRETEQDDFDQDSQPLYDLNLSMTITGDLPALNADFSHLTHLYMRSRPGHTSGTAEFLQTFPNLKALTLYQFRLEQIPAAIFRMADLSYLSLSECHITLTRETALELAQMERLD